MVERSDLLLVRQTLFDKAGQAGCLSTDAERQSPKGAAGRHWWWYWDPI